MRLFLRSKKLLVLSASLLFIIFLGACTKKASPSSETESGKVLIGISQFVTHPALDAISRGVQELVKAENPEVEFKVLNSQGDIKNTTVIAQQLKQSEVDLAVGIATPNAKSLFEIMPKTTPIVYSGITDPVAAGLVESFEQGGANITGYSDMQPVKSHIALLHELTGAQSIGHIYTSSEVNSTVIASLVEEACADLALEFVPSAITKSSEVGLAIQAMIGRADAIYVGTDNTVISALSILSRAALEAKIPIFSADPSSAIDNDILIASGISYYNMGKATGELINDILAGRKTTSSVPTQFMNDPADSEIVINLDVAAALGIEISPSLEARASSIIKDGEEQAKT